MTEQLQPLTITDRQFWMLAGISRGTFYKRKAAGVYKGLESNERFRWSRVKVEAWLQGQTFTDRRRSTAA